MRKLYNNRFTRPLFNPAMRALIWFGPTRRLVNDIQNQMSFAQKERFFWTFGAAFHGIDTTRFKPDTWNVRFGETEIRAPLTAEQLWMKWPAAIGLLGHDAPVKETYANILASRHRPDVFVDIGANYGTHSLLHAASGVRTIAFEPNATCAAFSAELFRANSATVEWNKLALGRDKREVVLSFPADDPSLGSVSDQGQQQPARDDLTRDVVEQRRLDDCNIGGGKLLVKIDVEGRELDVFHGAAQLIARARPMIIFESNKDSMTRRQLFEFLDQCSYVVAALPWQPDAPTDSIPAAVFFASSATNFIALPQEIARHAGREAA